MGESSQPDLSPPVRQGTHARRHVPSIYLCSSLDGFATRDWTWYGLCGTPLLAPNGPIFFGGTHPGVQWGGQS